MIVTYLRSSSFGTWGFCESQFFFNYVLGLPNRPHNAKANLGNCTHKALELLAEKKLAEQEGRPTFRNDELAKEWPTATFTVDDAIEEAWANREMTWDWTQANYRDHRKWVNDAMTLSGGLFNPLKRTVVWPEKYFDITFEQKWAEYEYALGGEIIKGRLSLKGTMDLVCSIDGKQDILEVVDWKTGLRKDWNKDKVKEYGDLRNDPQLRMYHYALAKLRPDIKQIIMTIVFIRDGGAYSLPFEPEDLVRTENMLKERFLEIKNKEVPARIKPSWKCDRLCYFGRNNYVHPDGTDSGKLICDYMHGEIKRIGMDEVVLKYGDLTKLAAYEGGGRTNKDKPKP